MKVDIRSLDNKVVGQEELSSDIFGIEPRKDILHAVVKWQLSKRRAGTHASKTISDIMGTTKKPFRQKGTGRARQGSMRSPQMRGGAVVFGPVVRDHGYDLQKKVRALGLKMALSAKVKDGVLCIVDSIKTESVKTKAIAEKIEKMNVVKPLFITKKDEDVNFVTAVRNLKEVDIIPAEGANVYDILKHKNILITKEGLEGIIARFVKYQKVGVKSADTKSSKSKKVEK